MSMMFPRLALSGLVLAAALAASDAFAADAKQIADSFVAAMTANGQTQATYEDASAEGDDVTITNLKITGDGDNVTIPSVEITKATPRDKGGFTADNLSLDGGALSTSDGATITWQTTSIENVTVPSPDEIKAKAQIMPFTSGTVSGLTIKSADLPMPLEIGEIDMELGEMTEGTPSEFTMNINEIKLPSELFADNPQSKAVLDALGYTSGFTVNVAIDGGYERGTDAMSIDTFAIDAVDVGKLSISGKFSGVPLSKAGDADAADAWQKTGKLESFSLRFDNTGIVERALDMQAKMQGSTRAEVVTQLSAAMPLMLNMIGNEPFQTKLATAGAAFLNDPKSITITASPSEPVTFEKIGTIAGEAPHTLPDVLAVDVEANK